MDGYAGKCNTVNNNCGCSWDLGDCCGEAQNPLQFSACDALPDGSCCLDPDFVPGGTTVATTAGTTTSRIAPTRGTTPGVTRTRVSGTPTPTRGGTTATRTSVINTRTTREPTSRGSGSSCDDTTACTGNPGNIGNGVWMRVCAYLRLCVSCVRGWFVRVFEMRRNRRQ